MRTIDIQGVVRNTLGENAAKKNRKEGLVPCVLYGGDKNHHFTVTESDLHKLIYNPDFHAAKINLDGKESIAIIKETQFHPVSDALLHVDFFELKEGKKITLELPVRYIGTAKGVRVGGKLVTKQRKLKVKSTLENLIPEIPVDLTELDLGKTIKVGDLKLENVEIVNSPSTPLATIEIPRSMRSEATPAGKKK